MSIFEKFKIGFKKSAQNISSGFREILIKKEIDDNSLNKIEEFLISSDVGIDAASEIRNILAQEKIISNLPSTDRLSLSESEILSQNGKIIEKLDIGKTGMIFSKIKNTLDYTQEFTYIVQIKNENNNVVSLSWVTGQVIPSQELGMSVSWTVQETGKYSVDRFVWNSIKGAIPLTEIVSTEILIK